MRKRLLSVLLALGMMGSLLAALTPAEAGHADQNIVVNSTGDGAANLIAQVAGICSTNTPNECTLRAAIEVANFHVLDDAHITFNITGPGPHVITLGSALPAVSSVVDIDGTTEDACGRVICVEVNGGGNASIVLSGSGANGSVVQGLFVYNSTNGVRISGASNVVVTNNWLGGRQAVAGPGNVLNGVRIDGAGTNRTVVGNQICDNPAGVLLEASGNRIEDNVVCRNDQAGVNLSGANNNQILDNGIFANGGQGIFGTNAVGNTISQNRIRQNSGEGISLTEPTTVGNTISQNRIFDNGDPVTDPGALGIELLGGANRNQAAPVLTSAELAPGGQTRVTGTLSSVADDYRIEFFSSKVCNPDRNGNPQPPEEGEGTTFVDDIVVTTNPATGEASFDEIIAAPGPGESVITATATRSDTSDTSQFSGCVEITPAELCPDWEHLTGHIHLVGTPGNDVLVATTGDPHVICGLGGNDHIEGGPGDDVLDGGPGDDTMFGRAGNDRLFGRSGNDIMRGGSGNDVIRGGSGDNFIFGGDGNDRLFGGTDNDVIRGGAGDDDIDTGPGNNIVRAGLGDDRVIGGSGINRLHGGPGNDYLEANGDAGTAANPNVLRGASGDDRLVGAPGPNSFTNFHCGPGNDEVVLRGGTNHVHQSC